MKYRLLIALLAAGCSRTASPEQNNASAPGGLEAAAIEAGVIVDPGSTEPAGLYARDGDRLCVVPDGSAFRTGLVIDLADQSCEGRATGQLADERLDLDFGGGCRVSARYEGDRIILPGDVPDACDALCRGRGSIAGASLDRLSDSASEAAAMRGAKGNRLCG